MFHCGFLNFYFGIVLFYIGYVVALKLFSCVFFFGGWICFGLQLKHILAGLLCMEVSLVGLLLGMMSYGVLGTSYFFFIVLSMGVCESALGMSLMMVFGRCYGNDFFSGLDSQSV
nr:NADH dehydrogenase subunit 4L [Propeamussium sp. mt1]